MTLAALPALPALRRDGVATAALRDALPAARPVPGPSIIRRSAWGADETRRRPAPHYDATVEMIVVHHTGTDNGITDWAGQVRRIYEFETANGFADIAYHYLVDPEGRIYEGRWAGGGAAEGEDRYGRPVRGGHALKHNSRTIGIALLGDYTKAEPTDAALSSLGALLVWKCARWNLDPRAESRYVNADGVIAALPTIVPHGQVRVTECPGPNLARRLPALRDAVARELGARPVPGGYRIVGADGREVALGTPPPLAGGAAAAAPGAVVLGVATHPDGAGYWAFGPDGGVFAYGSSRFHGSLAGTRLNAPIVGLAPSPSGDGYWLAAEDGGVFAFGDAPFLGALSTAELRAPIAGIVAARRGAGYWLYAADGGVFAYGDAPYRGSLAATPLTAPVTSMAATRAGYWLAARDGGVFAFGDAPFLGSTSTPAAVVEIVPTTSSAGYVLLSADGQVWPFGDAPYHGSALGALPYAVGIAGAILPQRA